jgi:hypothetical protein
MARVMPAASDDRALSRSRVTASRRQAPARVALTIRFEPILLDELRRRAEQAYLSLSQAVPQLAAEALRADLFDDLELDAAAPVPFIQAESA